MHQLFLALVKKDMGKKDRIVMVNRDTPKLVRLPNGRTFYAWYKRTRHANLPANIRLEGVYRQQAAPRGRRWQPRQVANQQGQGIGNFFKMAKKIAKSKIACNIGKKALEYLPDVYENLSGKIKNKKLKKKYLIQTVQKICLDTDQIMDKINCRKNFLKRNYI